MDSFELNKIAGAVLATMLVVFGIGAIGDIIFAEEEAETPGYVIAVAEEPAEGGETAEAAEEPIAVLLANADPAAGEAEARVCAACHTFEQGGANRVGPNLYSVVERPIASVEGFAYSDALQAHAQEAGNWTFDQLNAFIASPRQAVPGTTMGFAGIRNAEERADLLAYLRTLSANPVALPEAPAGAAAMAEAEPGEVPEGAEPPMPAAETAEPSPDQPSGAQVGDNPVEPQQQEQQAQPQQQIQPQQEQQPQGEPQQQQPSQGQETVLVVPPAGGAGTQDAPADAQQAPADAQQTQQQGQAPAQPAADLPPAVALMAEADVEAGQAEARKCQACHAFEEGAGSRVGPPLWGVVNRAVASAEGYPYSEALVEFGQGKQWDLALLDAFVQAPQQLVPGTKMAFPGIRNERDRAELLAYLNTLSSQPAPLPGGAAEGAPAQGR